MNAHFTEDFVNSVILSLKQNSTAESYKAVFVVRSDLDMGVGKIAAQVGHAAIAISEMVFDADKKKAEAWSGGGEKIVVLKGEKKEHLDTLAQTAQELGLITHKQYDAGRTQVTPGSMTCLGIFGIFAFFTRFLSAQQFSQ